MSDSKYEYIQEHEQFKNSYTATDVLLVESVSSSYDNFNGIWVFNTLNILHCCYLSKSRVGIFTVHVCLLAVYATVNDCLSTG